ncbi:MAG: hypothetical protein OIN88_02545 [Candidatus Methanoperedens sp.]|nr:hypothetical protein [Candidatus Methanoperedens sp.]
MMKLNRNVIKIILVTAVFLIILFAINQEWERGKPVPPSTPIEPPEPDIVPVSNYTVLVTRDVCEGCHMSGKPFIPQALRVRPHIEGGAYCLKCHTISHEVHPINQDVTCEKCHSTSATIPEYVNGSIPCNNCHGYPDPLVPSMGNLIDIHRPREITCNNCHTDECTKCHTEMGSSERWEKRLTHFRTITRALP